MTRSRTGGNLRGRSPPTHPLHLPRPLQENLAELRLRIERAARSAGRSAKEIRWVAVTKTTTVDAAAELLELGIADLGENRVDELERKTEHLAALGRSPRWHFVGHLQANKVRRVVRQAHVIHSVDSLLLLERIERIAAEEDRQPEVYLQVALTGEAVKHGFEAVDLPAAVRRATELTHLRLLGLMAMGPLEEPPGEGTRAVFAEAARLARSLDGDPALARAFAGGRCQLLMGMSADLELAIAAGTDLLRVGGALFQDTPFAGRESGRGGKA